MFVISCWLVACTPQRGGRVTIGVAFETLQTEYWVASFETIKQELQKRDIDMLEAISDEDPNRQLQQVKNFITRKVDGIILVPKDAQTAVPMIRAANQADIPIVLYNRPAVETDAKAVTVVADNYSITVDTVEFMVRQARKTAGKYKAMILIGRLGDINAVHRRDGFEDVVKRNSDILEIVARVPTDWNQEKALAGATNALQAHPDINFIFASSDFLLPSLISALKGVNKYKKMGEPGHVILGAFDGDQTAYRMLVEGYLDADGVQDVFFETSAAVDALLDLKEGKQVAEKILDKGFVAHQGNLREISERMWGARFRKVAPVD